MGESFGAWSMGSDAELMDFVSSVNVACGFHAGDASVIRKTVETAIVKGVAVGAHPSFPDLQGFGRREISDIVLYQVAALKGICEALGGKLHHVKPHGALYNAAAKDSEMSRAIAEAVRAVDARLILYGLSNSFLIKEAESLNLKCASEVFADRTYQADGSLTPRDLPNALIEDADESCAQVLEMIRRGAVTSTSGETVSIRAETVCIHGDGAHALSFARALRARLTAEDISIQSV